MGSEMCIRDSIKVLQTRKIPMLGKAIGKRARLPVTAPFYWSGNTWRNLQGNIESLETLLVDSGIADVANVKLLCTNCERPKIADQFQEARAEIEHAERALNNGDSDLAMQHLQNLHTILASIKSTFDTQIMARLKLHTGFNSGDGD